ncbi:MAG: YidB family protein [Prosthecobacter sp.]|nr:YidB family protein [Prosthecobacter sp.]
MGLFDSIAKHALGGFMGGQQAGLLDGLLREAGGLTGMMERFGAAGLLDVFASWVSTGPNQPILPSQLESVMGADALRGLAARVGFDVQTLLPLLAQFLPQIVDRLTPQGTIDAAHPSPEQLQNLMADVMKSGLSGLFGRKT